MAKVDTGEWMYKKNEERAKMQRRKIIQKYFDPVFSFFFKVYIVILG